ncbi:MAG: amidohydrolase [Phycisphaeraceae bacterium]|nr:MAG: amidohydrolase [Phycisphaeraceae bacterium]
MKVDLHTHILPQRWPDWTRRSGYAGWVELEHSGPGCARMCKTCEGGGRRFFRDVSANLWDPELRRSEMAASGVSTQVLSTVPVMFSHWAKPHDAHDLHRLLNDHLAGVVSGSGPAGSGPRPFEGLGVVPLQDTDLACRELERCVRDLGLRGVQIGTNVNGRNLDDPGLRAFFGHAAALDAAVFIHPWDMLAGGRMERYWMPWLVGMPTETTIAVMSLMFGGVLDGFPSLRVAFAHGGGSFAGTLGRIAHGFECRRDLFPPEARHPREYLRGPGGRTHSRFWVDSLVHEAGTLRALIALMGPSRVALGSDYPFPLGEDRPGSLAESLDGLGDDQRTEILRDAALSFLGIRKERA